jgi:hypothetical protein
MSRNQLASAHLAASLCESEFIQSLANPAQLFHLANAGLLSDPKFLVKLEELHRRYTSDPELLATLRFPLCLHYLHLLCTSARFRESLLQPGFLAYLEKELPPF